MPLLEDHREENGMKAAGRSALALVAVFAWSACDAAEPNEDNTDPASDALDTGVPIVDISVDSADSADDASSGADDASSGADTESGADSGIVIGLPDAADDMDTGDTTASGCDDFTWSPGSGAAGSGPTGNPCCGNRVCGTFQGCDCGTCGVGLFCNPAGACESPGAPLGAFCDDVDDCESRFCLSSATDAPFSRPVCTQACMIYSDVDSDGINDLDAPLSDCNPSAVFDGPAGNAYRCLNMAAESQSPLAVCVPGTTFAVCSDDSDCPSEEVCQAMTLLGTTTSRCAAKQRCTP